MCLHLTWLLVGTLASVMAKQLVFSPFLQSAATGVGHAVLICYLRSPFVGGVLSLSDLVLPFVSCACMHVGHDF